MDVLIKWSKCVEEELPKLSMETMVKAKHDNQPKSAKGWEDQKNKPTPSKSSNESPNWSYKSVEICKVPAKEDHSTTKLQWRDNDQKQEKLNKVWNEGQSPTLVKGVCTREI
jgi:hypothetical protein